MMTIDAGAATSTGRKRIVNEDAHLVASTCFAVADGMGGHAAGDRASEIAIRRLAEVEAAGPQATSEVLRAIADASEAIAAEAELVPSRRGMGTTLVGLLLVELAGMPHWMVFNVGDSRAYMFTGGRLDQITVDHSEVQELIDAGRLSPEDAERHPHRNVITRSMGSRPAPVVDTWMLPYGPDVTFLLCSDGLTTELGVDLIGQLLAVSTTAQVAADRLVEAAEAAGGRDNITAVVIRPGPVALDDPEVLMSSEDDTVPRPTEAAL